MLKHIMSEPSSVEGYLATLRQELSGQVPEHKLDEILAEAESHLRERTEAFVELGLPNPEEEALRAFVGPAVFAEEMAESAASDQTAEAVRRVRGWWSPIALGLVPGAILVANVEFQWWVGVLTLTAFVVTLCSGGLALVCRRADSTRLLAIGLALSALTYAGVGFTWVQYGEWVGTRHEAREQYLQTSGWASSSWYEVTQASLGKWVYEQPVLQIPPSLGSGRRSLYVAPPLHANQLVHDWVKSVAEAKRRWRDRGEAWVNRVRTYSQRQLDLAEQHRKAAESPAFHSGVGWSAAQLSLAITLLAVVVDRLMAALGESFFWRRRKRKRTKLGSA